MADSYDLGLVNGMTKEPAPDPATPYFPVLWRMLDGWKKEHPDIKLEIETVPWDAITQRVLLMAQSNDPADLVLVNDLNIPKLAKGGFLTPLDDMPGEWDDYNQNLLRGIASDDGKIFAIPWMTDCRHEVYWKEDWEKVGITTPPTTWDEFTANLVELKSAGVADPYTFWAGNSVHTPTMTLFSQIWMLGGDVIDADGRATLNTPQVQEAFQFYNRLMNELQVANRNLISLSKDDEYTSRFVKGRTSSAKNGAWIWNQVTEAGDAEKVGYFRTPKPSVDAQDATLSGFWAWELPAHKQPDEQRQALAFDFAMHFAGSEGQATFLGEVSGQLPTRPSAAASAQAEAKDEVWKFQSQYAVEVGRGMPPAADAGLLFDQIRIGFQNYLSGKSPLADALTTAEKAYNDQLR